MKTRTFEKYIEPIRVIASTFPTSPIKQPFPLQGSKRKQAPIIETLFPQDVTELFEPFCGSATVTLHLVSAGFSGSIHINDKNEDIAHLWRTIITNPKELSEGYATVWNRQFSSEFSSLTPREYFTLVRDQFNVSPDRDSADFLFILNRIVKAALRYNQRGEINQSADGRRVGAKPETTQQRILESSYAMKGAKVTSSDWLECIKDADRKAFIYLDPPYQGTTDTLDKRYIEGLSFDDFLEGVNLLIDEGLSALISYDAAWGPVTYGTPLHHEADLFPIDVITGVSAQGTLLGRVQEAHETLYLTPALVDRLGGVSSIRERLPAHEPNLLFQ